MTSLEGPTDIEVPGRELRRDNSRRSPTFSLLLQHFDYYWPRTKTWEWLAVETNYETTRPSPSCHAYIAKHHIRYLRPSTEVSKGFYLRPSTEVSKGFYLRRSTEVSKGSIRCMLEEIVQHLCGGLCSA